MKKIRLWRGFAALSLVVMFLAVWLSVLAFNNDGNVNAFLGIVAGGREATVYKSAYGDLNEENLEKLIADEDEFVICEVEEGSVLLFNEGNALPLQASERSITLFGYGSVNFSYRSTCGGPFQSESRFISIHDAFTNAGFSVNETVYGLYSATMEAEPSADMYTSSVQSTFNNYGDVAVVILTRHGGEGVDQLKVNKNGISDMALQPNERALLSMIRDSNAFGKTVVLLNSVYQMEVADLEEYGVDACLWIGNTGYMGTPGVVNILTGEANPSGKLVDTYATDSLSSPAAANMGEFAYGNVPADHTNEDSYYMVYEEGIYVGYKYYETRYEDVILNRRNASGSAGTFASSGNSWNYAEEVSYPFGHGLSYTTFTQEIVADSFVYDEETDTFSLQVSVTNSGGVAGRSVVEVYGQAPYTAENIEDKVEKSAVLLVGFAKTAELEPGASETVTVTFDRYAMASYNASLQRSDSDRPGGYVLDAGNYYFAVGDDAHDALNNILARKIADESIADARDLFDFDGTATEGDADKAVVYTLEETDTESYRYSDVTGNEVANLFTGTGAYDTDINSFYDADVATYLTRSDWNTFPDSAAQVTMNDALNDALVMQKYQKAADAPSTSDVTYGVDAGLTLADMAGKEYDDESWTAFIRQMSIEELAVCPSDQYSNGAVASVRKPKSTNTEGPEGVKGYYLYGDKKPAMCSASMPILAATWDTEMASLFGFYFGEDALYCGGLVIAMAPGADLHRTPFGGRAAEYFSESAELTNIMVQPVAAAMSEKGVIGCIKHFAVNDQETQRLGVACFLTEQALRENNLRAFEGTIKSGSVYGVMTSYNCIGACYSGNNPQLQNDLLRGEWGFEGFTICDATQHSSYSPTADCMSNGADMYCISNRTNQIIADVKGKDDGYLLQCLQETNHRIFYAYAHSNLMNGLTADTDVGSAMEWWKIAIICIDCAVGAVTLGLVGMYVYKTYFARPRKGNETEGGTEND